jgi:hypothetical protein
VKTFHWLTDVPARPITQLTNRTPWHETFHHSPTRTGKLSEAAGTEGRELALNLEAVLATIDWTVVDELRHVPSGSPQSEQESLRREYAVFRSLHRRLSTDLQPADALAQALRRVESEHPGFAPRYDFAFFFGSVGSGSATA